MPALSVVLLIVSFQFSLLFFSISFARPHQHCSVLLVLIHNIRQCQNVGRNVQPMGKTELIVMVKMESRHALEGPFGSEFPAICNHCGVMTASSRKTL